MSINIDNIIGFQFDYNEMEDLGQDVEVISAVWANNGRPLNENELNELNIKHDDYVREMFLYETCH